MGLDMYAIKVPKAYADGPLKVREGYNEHGGGEIAYWRKHHDLHGWMGRLFEIKGGTGVFNCDYVELTKEDLCLLRHDINADNLPPTTGFFFGNNPPDDESKKRDLEFIRKAEDAIDEGYHVYYTSWW